MRAKRADTKWNGVYLDPAARASHPYRAWIKAGGKLVQLGNFATPKEAILAADLSRYLVWGIDPEKWYNDGCHKMQKPPNTVPVQDLPFDPQLILSKLAAAKMVGGMALADNWTAYRDMAARLAGESSI